MGKLINELDLIMQPKARNALEAMRNSKKLKDLGVEEIAVNETKRSLAVQMAYYSRSRMDPADVRRMYAAAGLYDPSFEECRTPVTWTLDSKHIQGRAIDIVPVKNSKIWWNAPKEVWEAMGECGESAGLKWGGRWKNQDCPHYEM